jgi:hypothetical protein
MRTRTLTMAVALGLLAIAPVISAGGADRVTVGQFADQIVAAIGQDTQGTASVRATLRALGVGSDIDAKAPLTAGVAAMVAEVLRVKVAPPANPNSLMSPGQATTLAGHIGSLYLAAEEGSVEPPVQCLTSENRGACNDCCKEVTGLTGQYCGRFCHMNVATPSPDEPQP